MTTKSIFITGAAAGIGKACAEHFHARGWHVGLYDIDLSGCEALRDQLGGERVSTGQLDVTDAVAWDLALERFWGAASKRLDLLLNNAGVLCSGAFQDIELERQHQLVDINIKGVMNGCHRAFSYLKQTQGSRVINMASASAMYGQPDLASYSMSKFAVRGLTEGLDIEWRDHGIPVMAVWPLFVQTRMIGDLGDISSVKNMGVQLTAADVARVVWKAANASGAHPETHWPVGARGKLLYQATKFSPGAVNRWIVRRIAGH